MNYRVLKNNLVCLCYFDFVWFSKGLGVGGWRDVGLSVGLGSN